MKLRLVSWQVLCVILLLTLSLLLSCTAEDGSGSHTLASGNSSAEESDPVSIETPEKTDPVSDSASVSTPTETAPFEEITTEAPSVTAAEITTETAAETTSAPSGTSSPETTGKPEETTASPETTEKPVETTASPETTTEPTEEITYGNAIGSYCPIVTLDAYNGTGTVSLLDTRGKVTVLNFWATWCPPCVSELQYEFPRVTEYYGDRVAIMAVHVTDVSANVQAYLDANCQGFDMIFCQDEFLSPTSSYYTLAGGNGYIPYTLVLDETGKIVWKHTGATDFETLKSVIDGVLGNP